MSDAEAHIEVGIRHERSGELALAEDAYRSAARHAERAATLASAYRHLADVHRIRNDWKSAMESARLSLVIARDAGLVEHHAEALNAKALIHHSQGDFLAAEELYQEVLTLDAGFRLRGIALQNLGTLAATREEYELAAWYYDESCRAFREAAYLRGAAIALSNYARLALDQLDLDLAESICTRALETARAVEDMELVGLALLNQAEVLSMRGRVEEADELAHESLDRFRLMENTWRQVECLRLLGDLELGRKQGPNAAAHFKHALDLAQSVGALQEAAVLVDRVERALRCT